MKDFIKLVERMRGAQKSFKNSADPYFFEKMKQLEAQVDNFIRNYNINEVINESNGKR